MNKTILYVVLLSVFTAIFESEPEVENIFPGVFTFLNVIFAVLFLVEYCVRVWAMGDNPRYSGVRGKLRYALRPTSIVDLVATLALWIGLMTQMDGVYGVLLRLVRVMRVITLAKNSQWAVAVRSLMAAVARRRRELALSFGFAAVILLLSATMLFMAEGAIQPDAFGGIPRAMWWAMATLTTVGYGDVTPITALGKVLAGIVAVAAIGIVAMPTGIMAAAFSDAFQEIREEEAG